MKDLSPALPSRDWIAAGLIGVCAATCTGTALGMAGGLTGPSSALALFAGAACGFFALLSLPRRQAGPPPTIWELACLLIFGLFSFRAFGWLIFQTGNSVRVLSPNNLGDLSLHICLIRYLASGVRFWPESPIFAGELLRYPIGADLFNALLFRVGAPLGPALIVVGWLGAFASAAALWRWGRGFAVAGFMFAGGLAGFVVLWGTSPADFQDTVAWKSLPLAVLVPQRGMLYAIPCGLLLLDSWRQRLRGQAPLPFWAEFLLLSTLPLFHAHTLLAVGFVLACFLLLAPKPVKLHALLLGSLSLPVAFALSVLVSGGGHAGFIHFHPGWMQQDQNPLWFWTLNFGALPILMAWLGWRVLDKRSWVETQEARAFVVPALLIALATTQIAFAPWEWDNVKLMLWAYLLLLPFLDRTLIAAWPLTARIVTLFLLFFSGAVSLWGGYRAHPEGFEISTRDAVAGCAIAVARIDPQARFAASPAYNHPLLLLGRKLALGYEGHLWSHGYNYQTALADLRTLMNGANGWEAAARRIGTRYLCWSNFEEDEFPNSAKPWKGTRPLVGWSDGFAIYDLTPTQALSR